MTRLSSVLLCALLGSGPLMAENAAVSIESDVVYGHKLGLAMTLDVVKPPAGRSNGAGALLMVSGGWVSRYRPATAVVRNVASPRNQYEQLVAKGFTLFLVRHGSAPRFKVPEAVADVRRAVRFVRRHAKRFNVDPTRLGVFGGSAGGHLSLVLGTTGDEGQTKGDEVDRTSSRVAAVVAYFPPVDLRKIVGPSRRFPALDFDKELAPSVSPILFVSPDDPPTLLVHGDKDRLVSLSNSERIHQAFSKANVPNKLIVLKGAGHGFRGDDRRKAAAALIDWFDRHLVKPPAPE